MDGDRKCHKPTSLENGNRVDSSTLTEKVQSPQGSPRSDRLSLKKAKKTIGRFFFETGLHFNAVNSPGFQNMISFCAVPVKFEFPTCEELKGWILDDAMKEMVEYVDGIANSWADTGCSILLDEWMDNQGRHLVNVIVDCPRGTVYLRSADVSECIGNVDTMHLFLEKVLEEVGIENVVQVMTCSTTNFMKEVGKELMEKYSQIFWTVSASQCIELMLEKLCEIDLIKETLDKAKTISQFVHATKFDLVMQSEIKAKVMVPFLMLENIVLKKETLRSLCHSSNSTLTTEGQRLAEFFADRSFWSNASTILKGAIPLVRVIEWMNVKGKEQMGYIYETMDQVKETIKEAFKNKKAQYTQFWEVIDEVWNDSLYSPLHSAGYFLNPTLFYSEDMYIDPEVATGMLCCIVRSTKNWDIQNQITIQMEKYRFAKGLFNDGYAADLKSDISPVQWWCKYGTHCPELQRLAVRVLSQTCDGASKFLLKRSFAEMALSQKRNHKQNQIEQNRLFLQYNMQLQNFTVGKTDYILPTASNDSIADKMLKCTK